MYTIKVIRNAERFDFWPAYTFFVDGQKIGYLESNTELKITINGGLHNFKVKIGFVTAEATAIEVDENLILYIKRGVVMRKLFLVFALLGIIRSFLFFAFRNWSQVNFLVVNILLQFPVCCMLLYYLIWGRKKDLSILISRF